jgi:nicotinamide-nucleotide amidase
VRVEIVAVGTELLLGQIADTNSQHLGQQLAGIGVSCTYHQHVGDNHDRIVLALRTALARTDAVIVCGGLGPTQDDITREAIAEVMNVSLERDGTIVAAIAAMFKSRGRDMPDNNARQGDVPAGATVIPQRRGTAPGLICPVGNKVVYALPGVPYELTEMFARAVAPDLLARQRAAGETAHIQSRVLRTWGASESGLADALGSRFNALEGGTVTIAFLASGIEGLKVRLTARGDDAAATAATLDGEEAVVRAILKDRFGDIVFGVDEQTMETAVAALLLAESHTLGVAESVTGGLIASRLVSVPGASAWFRGGVVSYASDVKGSVLGVPDGPVVSADAAIAMAHGARRVLGSTIGLAVTGVAGPEPQEDQPPGTVFVGLAIGEASQHASLTLPGDRQRVRDYATISALDVLRRALS